tara:strand:+ start:10546 stop:13128 length:2583 start_codon:yes stop_codon:yes gene_type:complete
MKEAVTKIDLNFSNSGGGHSATVTSILNAKKIQSGEDLGSVIGRLGEVNDFSNERISEMMQRFVCTQVTTSSDPTKTTKTRRYIDRTSLMLESYVVLVRGQQLGPEGGAEFDGPVPYYSEVINSPLKAYKNTGPSLNGSVIEVGRIYNAESAATPMGDKVSLVYNDKNLDKDISINEDLVNNSYLGNPDLSQYDLKYGYTLTDVSSMLALLNITIEGLPTSKEVLFNTSGTLSSVISSVASYFGYFWFVNPASGNIKFINTAVASSLSIEDFTNSSDENIISASFTESNITNTVVSTYNGTTEKQDESTPDGDDRYTPMFLRRCRFERIEIGGIKDNTLETLKASRNVIGSFFSIFDQERDPKDCFDRLAYIMSIFAEGNFYEGGRGNGARVLLKNKLPKTGGSYNINILYPHKSKLQVKKNGKKYTPFIYFIQPVVGDDDELQKIYMRKDGIAPKVARDEARKTQLRLILKNGKRGGIMNRINQSFKYFDLTDQNGRDMMPKPSETELFDFLAKYFEIAGGFYISNAFSEYKAMRMEFDNTGGVNIMGPFEGNIPISQFQELSPVSEFLKTLDENFDPTLEQLGQFCQNDKKVGKVAQLHNFYFAGIRSLPKLEKKKPIAGGQVQSAVNYRPLKDLMEFYKNPLSEDHNLFGGPFTAKRDGFGNNGFVSYILDIVNKSIKYYVKATKYKNVIRVKYKRSKTAVNKDEEEEQDQDDALANSDTATQQNNMLRDRYDLMFKAVDAPAHSILNKLSVSSASGTKKEMEALRKLRGGLGSFADNPKSSSRTLYGLHVPTFKETMNSVSISFGSNGIQTTISESTIKMIPPDQAFLINQGVESVSRKSLGLANLNAVTRNRLGL